MKMCRNSVQERSRMKKKIMLFLLAVFLGFALLISAICFFVPKKNQNSRENPTEQQKTEDTAEQTEKEKREKIAIDFCGLARYNVFLHETVSVSIFTLLEEV